MSKPHIAGILLAAGRGSRFDPAGGRDKLMQELDSGGSVAVTSARNMLAVLPEVHAVARQEAGALQGALQAAGCRVTVCMQAGLGMGASLAHAIRQADDADGWLIALADMPYVQPSTMLALVNALRAGADIAVPVFEGRRGNPVAIGRKHLPFLLALQGDEGARSLLASSPVTEIAVNDEGIVRDIDTPSDLPQS